MNAAWFFSSLYFYIVESIVESALVCAVVWLFLKFARISDPATCLRFYLLPLLIPSFLSPAAHLLLPALQDTALSVYVERHWLPILGVIAESNREFAPFVFAAFGMLLFVSLSRWAICHWREGAHIHASADSRATRILDHLSMRFKIASPELVLTSQPVGPYTWHGATTRVVAPRALIETLDDEEVETILGHELAHILRGDTWLTLLAHLARDLMFFNPLAHALNRHIANLREEACDDLAARVTDKPLALASSLLKVCRGQQAVRVAPWVHAFITDSNRLERRVRRLIAMQPRPAPQDKFDFVFSSVAVLLTLAFSIV